MNNFRAKIVVYIKDSVKDIKGLTLKQAVKDHFQIDVQNCRVGSYYSLVVSAQDAQQARALFEKIAGEILCNDVIETFEILDLEDIYE